MFQRDDYEGFMAPGPDGRKVDPRINPWTLDAVPWNALVVPELPTGTPDDDLRPEEIAARQSLWRIARGEPVPSETLMMLDTLRLGAIKKILSERESDPTTGDRPIS
jgi:hypothetical protein